MKHKCYCGKQMDITYKGDGIQYPVFSCPEHGVDKNLWEEWWDKYSDRGLKKQYWEVKKELPSCIVSYFCHQFQKFYGYSYTLDSSNPVPYSNKEFTMARRIITMFGEDFNLIPNYIKWVFIRKVKTRKYPLNSLGFFASSAFVNEYKAERARAQKVKRSSKIPENFLLWCKEHYPDTIKYHEIETYNDLNVLIGLANDNDNKNEISIIEEARKRNLIPKTGYIKLEE